VCLNVDLKTCTDCKVEKLLGAFARKGVKDNGSFRIEAKCKECKTKYDACRYEKQIAKKIRGRKLKKCNVTTSDYKFDQIQTSAESCNLAILTDWIRGGASK